MNLNKFDTLNKRTISNFICFLKEEIDKAKKNNKPFNS